MIPTKKLKGLQLYEYLMENTDYHKMVRTVVAYLLQDETVPIMEDGKHVEENGTKLYQYANALHKKSDWTELVREYRPPPYSFKVKTGYAGAKYIDSMMSQVSKTNFVRVNNAYYDGLDASIDRDSIRSKIEIISEYIEHLPDEVIIVTGVEEEGLALKKTLDQYGKRSIIMNERSAANYKHFKIWMKEKNIEENIAIGDKVVVIPVVAKDGAILRAIYKNQYARGFGFMTTMLVHHYDKDDCPTSTAVGTKEREQCTVLVDNDEYVFKQLPSRKPLHFYPYIFDYPKLVETFKGTNLERLTRTWRHMWTILSWPKSKMSYISRFCYLPSSIYWRKGKDILDFTVENEDFKEVVRTVKMQDEVQIMGSKVVGKRKVIEDSPSFSFGPVDLNTRVVQKRPVEPAPPPEKRIVPRDAFSFSTPQAPPIQKEKEREFFIPPEKVDNQVLDSEDELEEDN